METCCRRDLCCMRQHDLYAIVYELQILNANKEVRSVIMH